jgi:AcrR family transcriptional regulator
VDSGSQRAPRLAAEDRRAQLIDCAQAELSQAGFGAVTIEAIARRAGVSRPVVYDLFGDLDSLLEAVFDRAEGAVMDALTGVLGTDPGEEAPGAFLIDSTLTFLQAVRAEPSSWRLVLWPPPSSPPDLQRRIAAARERITAELVKLLGWALDTTGPADLDVELIARLAEAVGEDAARLTLAHPRRFGAERLTESLRDLALLLTAAPRSTVPAPPVLAPIPPPGEPPSALADVLAARNIYVAGRQPAQTKTRIPQTERREQLLDVALELVAAEGFGALSIEAIARRAAVNRVVVYRSFANLRVLLTALMEREDERVRETLYGLLPQAPVDQSPAVVLHGALAFLLRTVCERPLTWRLALARPESAPRALQKIVNRRRAELAQRIEPMVRYALYDLRPGAADEEIEAIARMLLTIGEEQGRLALERTEFPPSRLLDSSWRLLTMLRMPG